MALYPLETLLDLLAPPQCELCYEETESLCINCRQNLPRFTTVCCVLCNKVIAGGLICTQCSDNSGIDELYCAGLYDGQLRQLIGDYKFVGKRALSTSLAKLLDERSPYFKPGTLVTFVPTISAHIRQRGFDHAKRLGAEFVQLRGLRLINTTERTGKFQQLGHEKLVRAAQAKSAFRLRSNTNLKNSEVILIDDVMTTGATVSAVAKLLHRAGAVSVVVIVVAHGKIKT